jgi:cell division protein FtsA
MKNSTRPRRTNIFTGIDIGSANIHCAILAYDRTENTNTLIGIGSTTSTGIKSGNIVSRDKLIEDIEKALTDAEKMANLKVETVWLSVSGDHIRGINTQGAIAIDGHTDDSEVTNKIDENDVRRVLEMAKAISFPVDRKILHILPQEYVVDVMEKIKEPLGISGRRLESRVHLVTVTSSAATNLVNCAEDLGLKVGGLVFQGLASSIATLDNDEKEMGVALINIGSRTTDVSIYFEGSIHHTGVLPIGADSITKDIAVMLNISRNEAERIKLKYGSAKASLASADLLINLSNNVSNKPINVSENELSKYIEARMIEIFQLVGRELSRTDFYTKLSYGIVITGGGALLPNISLLGEEILRTRIRIGAPRGISSSADISNKPQLSTAIGLALWPNKAEDILFDEKTQFKMKDLLGKVTQWFRGFF